MSPPSPAHPSRSRRQTYKRRAPPAICSTPLNSPHLTDRPTPLARARGAAVRRNCTGAGRLWRRRAPLIATTPGAASTVLELAVNHQTVCPPRRRRWSLVRPLCTPTKLLGLELAGDRSVIDDDPQPLIPTLIQRPTLPRTASRVMSRSLVDPLLAEPRAME